MMKRILCLIDMLGPGGAQRQMVGLATFLKEYGYEVTVAVYHKIDFYAVDLCNAGVSYHVIKKAERNATRLFFIAQYIRKVNPDIVISYLDTPNICTSFAKCFNDHFRLIVSERNTTQQTSWREKIRFNLFRKTDVIVPNAYSQADYIKRNFPFLSSKVVVIPNFVDLRHFYPAYHHRPAIPEIIVVATIWQSKNTMGFIDAVEILARKKMKFHVNWYGKNQATINYFNACQQKINALHLTDYISLLGKTDNIAECYREADYFCLPSFYEGTPNALCEAMASGLPIICSDVCDNSRFVEDSVNGCLFNPNDEKSIANAIEKMLLLSDDDYKAMCINSRLMAESKFSKERFVKEYLKLIES